jgi:hypothetical protein
MIRFIMLSFYGGASDPTTPRGRATGVGSELALASDMRFASREKAILS